MVWALIIVLSYSRYSFVWPTFSRKLVDVIEGLEAAGAFFEGVPNYLVIDNFPAAVAGVDPLHPRLTRGFLEYSQHRGFISDPARVRHPRDKPRVERGVPYVRERFFKGGEFTGLSDMRSEARRWCLEVAGQRVHGTTGKQPLAVFGQEERHALGEWDAEPYEMTDWRTAKVHPDHHIACQCARYSVPSATCPPGQKVKVRLGSKLVRIYHRGRLIKSTLYILHTFHRVASNSIEGGGWSSFQAPLLNARLRLTGPLLLRPLHEAFEPAEARRIAERLEIHYTPKHGSWLNMAEIEIGVLARQCLDRRIANQDILRGEVNAWQNQRNRDVIRVDWRFTTEDARIKLKSLYPSIQKR